MPAAASGRFARRNVAIRVARIRTKASRKSDFCCNYSCDHIVVVRVSSPLPGSFIMTAIRKTSGVVVAAAAAALFAAGAAGTTSARADDVKVHCVGLNACKGQGSCKQASHSCKGQNACKGQGWVSAETKGACLVNGGHVDG